MKTKIVTKTSVFSSGRDTVFEKLQEIQTLQYIAYPYAVFEPVSVGRGLKWHSGEVFEFKFRLFGFIPFGIHRINIVAFDINEGIYTEEGNKHVPVWNHRIILEDSDDGSVRYTDEVEIGAGWKTPFVWLWASMFYAHRQKKWKKLLKKTDRGK